MTGIYMKHQFSCAKDQRIEWTIDEPKKIIEAKMEIFDSYLFADFVVKVLPRQPEYNDEPAIIAYRDDNVQGWVSSGTDWGIYLTISGVRMRAEVVVLSKALGVGRATVMLDAKNVEQRLF